MSSRTRLISLVLATAVAGGAAWSWLVTVAQSDVAPAIFVVDSTADGSDALPGDHVCATAAAACTLRAAIEEATTTNTSGPIDLPGGHYVLGSAIDVPRAEITIRGADRATTIIDGDHATRAFVVVGGAALGLERLTIINGSSTEEGGAIRVVDAALSLDDVVVATSAAEAYGGAIFAGGASVAIANSVFDHDTGLVGGAVAVIAGDLSILDSTFTNCLATDSGGAVAAFNARSLTIAGSTFSADRAEQSGGAIFLSGSGGDEPYAITGSTFTENQAFGGAGGAIAADGLVAPGTDGGLVVTGCTFTSNGADDEGGAISAGVAVMLAGNTFTENLAPENADVALPEKIDLCATVGICPNPYAIDSFRCYQAKEATFAPITGIRLADVFGDVLVDLKKPQLLCAPADTRGSATLTDEHTHLEGYAVKPQKGQKPAGKTGLHLTSALGGMILDTAKVDQLLLPTATDPVTSPNLSVNALDRYTCHKAKLAKGQPKLAKDLQLTVADPLSARTLRVAVKKIVRLCAPVGADGGAIKNAEHLLCLQVAPTKGRCDQAAPVNPGGGCKKEEDCGGTKGQTTLCALQAKFAKVAGLRVANDLDTGALDAVKDDVVCLPALLLP